MTCPRCGTPLLPTRRGMRHFCPLCTSAKGQQTAGRKARKALRVRERPTLQHHFVIHADPLAMAETAWRLRVLALAKQGDRDALLSLWDVLGVRLPIIEAQIGWVPPRGRPARAGGGRPWLAEIGG